MDAVFICPDVYLDHYFMEQGDCVLYPLLGVANKRYCYVCTRKDAYLSPYARAFIELIRTLGKKKGSIRRMKNKLTVPPELRVEVPDMLRARDGRALAQRSSSSGSTNRCCFTMNIPGPQKVSPLIRMGLKKAYAVWKRPL